MEKVKEDKTFIYNVPRKRTLKYLLQYISLMVMEWCYKFIFTFLGKNMKPKKYTLSICAIFKNEAPFMKEWIEFHLLMGVDHFYLYNNNSEDNFREVLAPYVEQGVVTLIEWPDVPGQISAYRNWYDTYRHESNWCTFIDLDEFLFPTRQTNLKEWLSYHVKYPLYAVYWRMFGTSGRLEHDFHQLTIEQYTCCWDKYATATKLIYNTDYDIERFFSSMMHKFNVKYLGLSVPPVNPYGHFINKWEIHRSSSSVVDIQCNHYWSKAFREYEAKHRRGDAVTLRSVRDMDMFLWHEHYNRGTDFKIFRFLVELKIKLGVR
ncbi:MAG: glycosyltransferase family 92 protein [Bacteroidales bacterium]|nr:glycosyltransferase family 92 protein [Bacteroidales bacterium]